jgi:hypothetical protein
MYENIIQQAMAEMVPDYEKIIEKYLEGKDFAVLNTEMKEQSALLGINIIKRLIEDINRMLRESRERHEKGWYVVKDDARSLLTSLGNVRFERTLFINHQTGERAYLTDRMLCLTPGERMTEDAVAQMLEEAAETSYRKGGEACSILGSVSKETVKEKIHGLVFPRGKDLPGVEEKRKCEYLYIEADEDHVSLQFHEKKGDLKTNENGYKDNTALEKLVYVHEGVEKDSPKGGRNRLINAHYFAGGYPGAENNVLAEEIYEYLDRTYDLEKVKKIYLSADGGGWIKGLKDRLPGVTYVLDEFHMQKYLRKMTGHLLDSAEEAGSELYRLIRKGKKAAFAEYAEVLSSYAEKESTVTAVEKGKKYILDNWQAAVTRLNEKDKVYGCSAEGHVSHLLSSRMSSRPMGWSVSGADRMARLRVYAKNGYSMLKLVKMQPQAVEAGKAAGAEEMIVFSAEEVNRWEKQHYKKNGKYFDSIQAGISAETRKKAWFKANIREL